MPDVKKSLPDIVRLREVYFNRNVPYGQSQKSGQAMDNGSGHVRIELLGWHTVMVTPKHGKVALVSWAGCHGVEWEDCATKGCALPRGHEINGQCTDIAGKPVVVGKAA